MTEDKARQAVEDDLPPEDVAPDTEAMDFTAQGGGDGTRVMMGEDIEIFPQTPYPDLGDENVRVFEARDRRLMGEQVAFVCGRGAVPRLTSVASYRHLKNPAALKLVGAGVVDWKPENRQRFALVYERPPARRLLQDPQGEPLVLSEDKIYAALVQPVIGVLSDLANIDLVHGAVNPMNIFFTGAEGAETALLGECLSTAPSRRQHVLFEPVERAMAQASGRGQGTSRDDLYAFGICVAMAVRGENLIARMTPDQILHAKMSEGTYSLVIGRERMPPGIAEFLRGVLSDDTTQRWDIGDAVRWLEGRRQSPRQPRATLRAARPMVFKDKKYWNLNVLAYDFSKNVAEAAQVIENDQFDLWIKRNFEDKALIKHLEDIWGKEKGDNRHRLVANICMALDPYAPVRYKGLAVFPAGFGMALADAIAREEDQQPYGEIISLHLFSNWINMRFDEVPDASLLFSQFEKCRNYLNQKIPGYGMERVLYTLNKECVCMSPVLKDFFVMNPGMLLLALEKISRRADRPDSVLDRHMIAFLSVREAKMVDPYLGHIMSHNRSNHVVGIVRVLAAIQRRFSIGPVPGVTSWMVALSGPAVERYNDHDLRKSVAAELEKVKDSGSLVSILELIDDARVVQEDAARFNCARAEYAALSHEKKLVESYIGRKKMFGYGTGRQVAMLVSSFLALVCILGYLALYFTEGLR